MVLQHGTGMILYPSRTLSAKAVSLTVRSEHKVEDRVDPCSQHYPFTLQVQLKLWKPRLLMLPPDFGAISFSPASGRCQAAIRFISPLPSRNSLRVRLHSAETSIE